MKLNKYFVIIFQLPLLSDSSLKITPLKMNSKHPKSKPRTYIFYSQKKLKNAIKTEQIRENKIQHQQRGEKL